MSLTKSGDSAIAISIYPNRVYHADENFDLDHLLNHPALTPLQQATLLSARQMIEAVVQDLGGFEEASWYGSLQYEPLRTFGDGRKPFFVSRGRGLEKLIDIDIENAVEVDDEDNIVRRLTLEESDNFDTYRACLTLADFAPRYGWFIGKAFGFINTSYAHACQWVKDYQGLQVAHVAEAIAFLEAHPHCTDELWQMEYLPLCCPSNKDFCYEPFVNLNTARSGEKKYRLTESDGEGSFYLIGIQRVPPPQKR